MVAVFQPHKTMSHFNDFQETLRQTSMLLSSVVTGQFDEHLPLSGNITSKGESQIELNP